MLENINFYSPLKSIINNDFFKSKLFKTNTFDISEENNYQNELVTNEVLKQKFVKIFDILKHKLYQNFFEKFKLNINNILKDNKTTRNNFLSFELKKEIFLDKVNTNRLKEEYYNKCNIINNKGINNNLREKLIKYISKTHNILLDNNSIKRHKNYYLNQINNFNNNNIKIELKNKTQSQSNNVSHLSKLNDNFLKRNKTPNFHNNDIRIKVPKTKSKNKNKTKNIKNIYNYFASFNGKYNKKKINYIFKDTNNLDYFRNIIDNEEKQLVSASSPYTTDIVIPKKIYNNENIEPNIKYNNYYNNINNIFLSELPENLEDNFSATYNSKNNFNLYSNFINYNFNINKCIKNDKVINITERKTYKKFNSLNSNKKNFNSINELNKGEFKEIIINYNNNSGQLSFDDLRKDLLRKEFNNNKFNENNNIIKKTYENEYNKNYKNKLSKNKYITYNNIININEPYIMQNSSANKEDYNNLIIKDINLSKNYENKTSKIQSYVISFNKPNSTKNSLRNFREDIVYHRPKSSSKFKKTNKIINYFSDNNILSKKKYDKLNGFSY